MDGETQPIETAEMNIERQDNREVILRGAIRQSVLEAPEEASSQIKIISEQYKNASALVPNLSEPGKASELIAALEGLAHSAGVKDFSVGVNLPEDALPETKARVTAEEAERIYKEMPDIIATQYLNRYKELQQKEAEAYSHLEEATEKDPELLSRSEVRALSFDRRLVGYEMIDEETRILELVGASDSQAREVGQARAEAHTGRIDTQEALDIVDMKRCEALETKIKNANEQIERRKKFLIDMLDERPMLPTLVESRDLDQAATVLVGYWPDLANEKIAIELQKQHVRLMPLIDKIKAGTEAVGEKAVQLRNVVKDSWDIVIRETAGGYVQDVKGMADSWRANIWRNRAELQQEEIQGAREYYNKRHDVSVQKQMKTELELVRRQGRDQGLSVARIEGMIEERRQQYAEIKNPNESIAFFQNKLAEHVHALVVNEESIQLVRVVESPVSAQDTQPITIQSNIDTRAMPPVNVENTEEDTQKLDRTGTIQSIVPNEENDMELDLSRHPFDTKESSEPELFSRIQKHWNKLSRLNTENQDPNIPSDENRDIKSILEDERQFVELIRERERNGLQIKNKELEKYINAYRRQIYLLREWYGVRKIEPGQKPIDTGTFGVLQSQLEDERDTLEEELISLQSASEVSADTATAA